MRAGTPCPSCDLVAPRKPFYAVDSLPIHSCLLVPTRKDALDFPRGSLQLVACPACGFVWNDCFQPERMRYSPQYEEIQSCSPRFCEFQTALIEKWIPKYSLPGKRIVEIGCGKGDFLRELCRSAHATGIGIDPSYRGQTSAGSVRFLQEHYQPKHAALEADFVCCRHTLEHIRDPLSFLRQVVRSLHGRREAIVCFEVPDLERILVEGAFWDIYYEHCSYFTCGAVARLFRAVGLEVLDLYKEFDGQYLLIEGCLAASVSDPVAHPAEEPVVRMMDWIADFAAAVTARTQSLIDTIDWRVKAGQRVVLWGGGSKAVALLTQFDAHHAIQFVVDVNPVKHGKFIPGSGQEVVAPQQLTEIRPDVVVIMNGIYQNEIQAMLRQLGLVPELIAL